jgi:tetratricopeptide (TPR) repeat protein
VDANEATADTNTVAVATHADALRRDEAAENYSQIQAQLHATQTALEQFQQIALATSQSNTLALAQGLQSLEQTVSNQRLDEVDAAHKTQQLTLLVGGAFGLIGMGFLLMMVYYQWRAFTQLAQISARQQPPLANGHAAPQNGEAVHQLAAAGRATVEASTAQLTNVVSRLEYRIHELENGHGLLPEIPNGKPADLLAEGQRYLDSNQPLQALDCFEKLLAGEPNRSEALVKRAAALEKLGRDDEALASYNRAIAADNTLVIAHLHKGGLLNRLRRYDEALNCYEQALLGQDKKAKV